MNNLEVGKFYRNMITGDELECKYSSKDIVVMSHVKGGVEYSVSFTRIKEHSYKEYIPVKTYVKYANIYRYTTTFDEFFSGSLYNTKEEAKFHENGSIRARIKLEFTEGQFDD